MFKKARIILGEGFLDRFTIFEWKRCFSIYFHVFNTVKQDRFHTHAFNGIAILFYGSYEEEVKIGSNIYRKNIGPSIRYIPRSYNHKLLKSKPNTLSILFAGPWSKTWTEENDQFVRTLTWGRKEIQNLVVKQFVEYALWNIAENTTKSIVKRKTKNELIGEMLVKKTKNVIEGKTESGLNGTQKNTKKYGREPIVNTR